MGGRVPLNAALLRQGPAKLAKVLKADEDELLLLAEKIPADIRRRVIERPDAFRKLAGLDDETLDRLVADLG